MKIELLFFNYTTIQKVNSYHYIMSKTSLEYFHDASNSKVWNAELSGSKITIQYGKKGSELRTQVLDYPTSDEALADYKTRVAEKIKKGYSTQSDLQGELKKSKPRKKSVKINTKTGKKVITTPKANKDTGKQMSAIQLENTHPVIKYLVSVVNDITKGVNYMYKDFDNDDHDKFEKKTSSWAETQLRPAQKHLEKLQNATIQPYLKSGIIIKKLHEPTRLSILASINKFAESAPIDYHPGSNDRIRDIVHPSLYPAIVNIKRTANKMDYWDRPYEASVFQWMPSEFHMTDGKCKIASYINNVPTTETELYKNIETVFEAVLPMFEDVWSYITSLKLYDGENPPNEKSADKLIGVPLKDRNLQVITKIVRISLNDDSIPGAWHLEGMSHENIVATTSITLEQTTGFNTDISFKRMYTQAEASHLLYESSQISTNVTNTFLNSIHVPIGKKSVQQGDVIAFPNSHIHKVEMNSKNKSHRTLLVFWLINPDVRIMSSKDIHQQTYPLKQALANRLKLMSERTYHKQSLNQRELNLCEH
jgi:predicted DNA-binding WGR domain protein